MKTITNITYPAFALFTLACFALSQQARATCQDACLTNDNTVQGDDALVNNTSGFNNTAIGFNALTTNATGGGNTATGALALFSNTTGAGNTAIGDEALFRNSAGNLNTATGEYALEFNTTGSNNTATGWLALAVNTTGHDNAAMGNVALQNNTGSFNTAIGSYALNKNTTGNSNVALGFKAGSNRTTGSNDIDIGNRGVAGESNTIRIGTMGIQNQTFIAGISGVTVASGVGVIIDTNGQLGTIVSSARFKEDIKPMDKSSEAILALQPVTFHYKHELDPDGIPQFGLVAEEVEKVNPDLVARDEQGKPYTVRYEAVNAMLLNEFLKEHQTVQELKKQVADLTAGLQKVSAQLALAKSAPKNVVNNQ